MFKLRIQSKKKTTGKARALTEATRTHQEMR